MSKFEWFWLGVLIGYIVAESMGNVQYQSWVKDLPERKES